MEMERKLSPKETFRAILTSLKLILGDSPWFLGIIAINEVISRLAPFANAFLLAKLVTTLPNVIESESARSSATSYIIGLAIVSITPTAISSFSEVFLNKQRIKTDAFVKTKLRTAFAFLPYAMYEDKRMIDAYERADRFASQLTNFVMYRLRTILGSAFSLIIASIAFWSFSPWLTLIIFILTVPTVWIELRLQKIRELQWRKNTLEYRKAAAYSDLIRPRMIKESRLLGLVKHAITKAQHHELTAEMAQVKIDEKSQKYRFGSLFMGTIIEVIVLLQALQKIVSGNLPIGQFVFVQQIASQYLGALREVSWTVQDLDDMLFGVSEFQEILSYEKEPKKDTILNAKGNIVFDNVSFTYPQTEKPSLTNISLTIPAGETVAIVGENGAGKTTLVKLLMKLYDPTEGNITAGKQSLVDVGGDAWHRHLGVLFQDFQTFYDFTVAENVGFGDMKKSSNQKSITEALQKANAHSFVEKLPKKQSTYLGKFMDEENGTDLSGGQIQRLAIARALFRDSDILILDEPTSAIDSKGEYDIFRSIEKARSNKTTILISHRFSTIRKASLIYVLEKGSIKEYGTHEQLMKNKSLYHEMFSKQAEGYK